MKVEHKKLCEEYISSENKVILEIVEPVEPTLSVDMLYQSLSQSLEYTMGQYVGGSFNQQYSPSYSNSGRTSSDNSHLAMNDFMGLQINGVYSMGSNMVPITPQPTFTDLSTIIDHISEIRNYLILTYGLNHSSVTLCDNLIYCLSPF